MQSLRNTKTRFGNMPFTENSERPCVPTDFLNVSSYFDNNIFNNVVGGENTVCLPLCLRTEYQVAIRGHSNNDTVFSTMCHTNLFPFWHTVFKAVRSEKFCLTESVGSKVYFLSYSFCVSYQSNFGLKSVNKNKKNVTRVGGFF